MLTLLELPPAVRQPEPVSSPERASPPVRHGVVLNMVPWSVYHIIGEALRDRPALRLTFDRGRMEIMTTSFEHEWIKKWFSKLVEVLTEELGKPTVSAGSMTFQREALERGFEPDDCFWIEHESDMRGRAEFDQTRDPPPDLTLEIEITRSALNRMAIFAAYKVPEVWRFDGEAIHIHRLQYDGTYLEVTESPNFPGIRVAEIATFLRPDPNQNNLEVLRAFRTWVRSQIAKP